MKQLTIAVFGSSGFVGRNMVQRLKERGMDVVASDVKKGDVPKGVNFVRVDILNFDEVCKVVEGADEVIHLAASIEQNLKNQTVNLGTGKGTSIKEIVDLCGKIAGTEPDVDYLPPRKGEISNFSADVTKLNEIFAAPPQVKIEEGLAHTFDWIKRVM